MRICSVCSTEHDRNHAYCASCHARNMREWRKTHPLSEGAKKRDIARSYANVYKKRGNLSQRPCCICGDLNSEMHHPDHEQPLLVVLLCREHHLGWHEFWKPVSLDAWEFWAKMSRESAAKLVPKTA